MPLGNSILYVIVVGGMLAYIVYQVVMGRREQAARLRRMDRPLERPSAWVEVEYAPPAEWDVVTGEVLPELPSPRRELEDGR